MYAWASLVAKTVKNLLQCRRPEFNPWGQNDPLEKEMAIYSSILAWEIPWERSLAGYSPWGHEESDTIE